MKPEIWGPHMWLMLHIITMSYPDNPNDFHKQTYADFFTLLKDILPCEECQKHFKRYLAEYPIRPHLDTRADLIKWLIQIHNFVNISLGKRTYEPAEIIQLYENINPPHPFANTDYLALFPPKNTITKSTKLIFLIFALIGVIIWLWYIYEKYYFFIMR